MTTPLEIERILAEEPRVERRLLYFCALLAREVSPRGIHLIIVGGTAIEAYTQGRIASGEIDIVGPRKHLLGVLEGWGFHKDGHLWQRTDWEMAVDIVSDDYTGDLQRTRVVDTPYGGVRLAAVEDLVVKRLTSAKDNRVASDLDQALILAHGYEDEIDWKYVSSLSERSGVSDLFQALRDRMEAERTKDS